MSQSEDNGGISQQGLIVAAIGDHSGSDRLIEAAVRMAGSRGWRWVALHVGRQGDIDNVEQRHQVIRHLTRASQAGAEIVTPEAPRALDGILAFIQQCEQDGNPVEQLVVGASRRSIFWFRPPLSEQLAKALRNKVAVQILPLGKSVEPKSFKPSFFSWPQWLRPLDILFSLAAVLLAFCCVELMKLHMPRGLFLVNQYNISIIFLIACGFSAGRYGLLPGLIAASASFFLLNYFYTRPFMHFSLTQPTDQLSFALFMGSAFILSLFTSSTRARAESARRESTRNEILYRIARISGGEGDRNGLVRKLAAELGAALAIPVCIHMPGRLNPDQLTCSQEEAPVLSESAKRALQRCWSKLEATGAGVDARVHKGWRFEPMITPRGAIGILGVYTRPRDLNINFGRLVTALADQCAAMIERVELSEMNEESRIREEREKLRSMLLSSVSHDLKTPLASIIGSLGVYHSMGARLDEENRNSLTETAYQEALRLDSFITNILDMTRIETGEVRFKKEWHEPADLVTRVRKRMEHRLRQHPVTLHPFTERVEVEMDVMMTEQVLQNLLDNAAKYSPEGQPIEISMTNDSPNGPFHFLIRDHGSGIPPDMLEAIFDKYTRLKGADTRVAGTGLGLAICRAVTEAQGGSVRAQNHPSGGAVFTVTLPRARLNMDARRRDDGPATRIAQAG